MAMEWARYNMERKGKKGRGMERNGLENNELGPSKTQREWEGNGTKKI
jgi:hypothetical protein